MIKKITVLSLLVFAVLIMVFGAASVSAQSISPACQLPPVILNANLHVGSTGTDVATLQAFLQSRALLIIPTGVNPGYFGGLTFKAVQSFQSSRGISSTGFVGPITRGAIAVLGNCAAIGSLPSISSLTPLAGPVGTQITLRGIFTPTGNKVNFGDFEEYGLSNLSSSDGVTLTFNVPQMTDRACAHTNPFVCPDILDRQVVPGRYDISVTSANATSNSVSFNVTGPGQGSQSATVAISSPDGGETLTIGQPYSFDWSGNNIPYGAYLVLSFVNGPTPGYFKMVSIPPSYIDLIHQPITMNVPSTVTQGDVVVNLQSGSYKLQTDIYDRAPCLNRCANGNPAILLATDQSNANFNIAAGTGDARLQISLLPTSGPIGTSVIINGNDYGASFNSNSVVHFGLQTVPSTVGTINCDYNCPVPVQHNLQFRVPQPSPGMDCGGGGSSCPQNYNVYVSNGTAITNQVSFSIAAPNQTPPPLINSLYPLSGPVGTSVTINGSHFGATQGSSYVMMGGPTVNSANGIVTYWSETSIRITVPSALSGSPGTYPVTVQTSSGTSNPVNFTLTAGSQSGAPTASLTVNNSTSYPLTVNAGTPITFNWNSTNGVYPYYSNHYGIGNACSNFNWYIANASGSQTLQTSGWVPCTYVFDYYVTGSGSFPTASIEVRVTIPGGPPNTAPTISFLSPNTGPIYSTVTIHGSGFAASSNVITFTPVSGCTGCSTINIQNSNTSNDSLLTFTVPGQYPSGVSLSPGNYIVGVNNSHGQSNGTYFNATAPISYAGSNSASIISALDALIKQGLHNQSADINESINQLLKSLKSIWGL